MEIAKKKYYLEPNEFAVLVANVGVKTLYGIHSSKAIDSKEMCRIMHSLYINQVIDNPDGNSFSVQQDMKDILYDIRDSKYMLTLETKQEIEAVCCYLGKSLITVYESQGKLVIATSTREEFQETIKEIMGENGVKLHVREAATGEEREVMVLKEDNWAQQLKAIYEEYCKEG